MSKYKKEDELEELKTPIGKWIHENMNGIQMGNGILYHYSDVCIALKKFLKDPNNKDYD